MLLVFLHKFNCSKHKQKGTRNKGRSFVNNMIQRRCQNFYLGKTAFETLLYIVPNIFSVLRVFLKRFRRRFWRRYPFFLPFLQCVWEKLCLQKNVNIITKKLLFNRSFCKNILTLSNDSIQFSKYSFGSRSSANALINRTNHFPDKLSALSQLVVRNAPRCVLRCYECKVQLFFSFRAWLG